METDQPQKGKSLPKDLEHKRTRVKVGIIAPSDAATYESYSMFNTMGFDNSINLESFKDGFQIANVKEDKENMELTFDMIGIDAPLANAFRRIMISEVPTMAIERVYMLNNTGVIQDEVLAHRLGLVPIIANPNDFDFPGTEDTATNSLSFTLDIKCTKNPRASNDAPAKLKYINGEVLSDHLIFKPAGEEQEDMVRVRPIRAQPGILLAKLRHNQEIKLEARCVKGLGKDHAKFSPVATATYRLLPEIVISEEKPILDEKATKLVQLCPMKVFDIEDMGSHKKAIVAKPRECSMCRECIRDPQFAESITLARVKNHFIFSIESTGALEPKEIFLQAVEVLKNKCTAIEEELDKRAV